MAIALVSSRIQQSPDTNGFTTTAIDTTGATLLEVVIVDYKVVGASTLSDSKSNTWVQVGSTLIGTSSSRVHRYRCAGGTVGSGHTVTLGVTGGYPAVSFSAWSGTHATPDDQNNGTAGTGSTTTQQPGSITPSVNDCLVLTGVAVSDVGYTMTIDGGFTILHQITNVNAQAFGVALAYLLQTTAAAANPTWTFSGASTDRTTDITSIKSAAAGVVAKAASLALMGVQ